MFKSFSVVLVVLTAAATPAISKESLSSAKDAQGIKAMYAQETIDYQNRDMEKVLALYDNDELLFFDLVPPVEDCCGIKRAREKTKAFFDGTVGPITSEYRELKVTVDHDMAYSTAILRFGFTGKDGKKLEVTSRLTDVWRRMNGKWTIVHEHVSVPLQNLASWMEGG